jgi:hypothetical protein
MQTESQSNEIVTRAIRRVASWRIVLVISTWLSVASAFLSGLEALNLYTSISAAVDATNSDSPISDAYWADVSNSEAAVAVFAILSLPVLLTAIVSLIGWTHANARLAFLLDERKLSFGTGWAIGSWFVPILNLFRPRKILKESLAAVSNSRFTLLLNTWWVLFLINTTGQNALANLQMNVYASISALGETGTWPQLERLLLELKSLLLLEVIYGGVALIASTLLLLLIRKTKPVVSSQSSPATPEAS